MRELVLALVCVGVATGAAPAQTPSPCGEVAEFRWLDFWVGHWTVHIGEQQVGTNRISKVLDGCAVTEDWTDARGRQGRSLFYRSPATGTWAQVWVTDLALAPGGVKEKALIARYPDGAVRFQGEIAGPNGLVLDRTTLRPLEGGRVHQTIEVSDDGGISWTPSFDAIYRPASSAR